jgi:carbon-monoxide dehydrogenase small subunit
MIDTHRITLVVNGLRHEIDVESRLLLVDAIRGELGLTGTHIGCEHGVCGTCTVLMDGRSVRSCITFAVTADNAEITTIEGVSTGAALHPIQESFWDKQGVQCGYCTPGMVLRVMEFLAENPDPTADEAREAIASNLCRCTGYQFIVDSVLEAARRMNEPAAATTGSPA